jgi:hypothetical protein
MTYDVVIQPRAARDIQLAAQWILAQSGSPATAVRWARKRWHGMQEVRGLSPRRPSRT